MNLKELVEKEISKGLSRRAVASKVGVSLGTVQNVLYGGTELKNSTLAKFSAYFKTPVENPTAQPTPNDITLQALLLNIQSLTREIAELRKDINKHEKERSDLWDASNRHRAMIDRIVHALALVGETEDVKPLKSIGDNG